METIEEKNANLESYSSQIIEWLSLRQRHFSPVSSNQTKTQTPNYVLTDRIHVLSNHIVISFF